MPRLTICHYMIYPPLHRGIRPIINIIPANLATNAIPAQVLAKEDMARRRPVAPGLPYPTGIANTPRHSDATERQITVRA